MPNLTNLFVLSCSLLSVAGWTLSALGLLRLAAPVGAAVVVLAWVMARKLNPVSSGAHIKLKRFSRALPAIFLLLALIAGVGGAIHPPNNYDALTYRLPRILHWLANGSWYWVPTLNDRVNFSGATWEWLAFPQFAAGTDRFCFLINWFAFLLLPGLIFSILKNLGGNRRSAWVWMWLLPSAYGYATQAGSVGNDLLGTFFCLASIHYGLRARNTHAVGDVGLAALAAALLTSVKLSNLPLALPCLVAMAPALPTLLKQKLCSTVLVVVVGITSALPTMALNHKYTGSWNGDPTNRAAAQLHNPIAGLIGNTLLIFQQSFMPPVLPEARKLGQKLITDLPPDLQNYLDANFPRYRLASLNELPQEEGAGLGLGITSLVIIGLIGFIKLGFSGSRASPITGRALLIAAAGWIATLVFMLKLGSEAAPRLLLPFYPLLIIPVLVLPLWEKLWRVRLWRCAICVVGLSVLPALILSPSRPILPIVKMMQSLTAAKPESAALERALKVYSGYANRHDLLSPLREQLPASVQAVGLVAGSNDSDYSLWRPFGGRRVYHLRSLDVSGVMLPAGLEWIVIRENIWSDTGEIELEDWIRAKQGETVARASVISTVSRGPEFWRLVRISAE